VLLLKTRYIKRIIKTIYCYRGNIINENYKILLSRNKKSIITEEIL